MNNQIRFLTGMFFSVWMSIKRTSPCWRNEVSLSPFFNNCFGPCQSKPHRCQTQKLPCPISIAWCRDNVDQDRPKNCVWLGRGSNAKNVRYSKMIPNDWNTDQPNETSSNCYIKWRAQDSIFIDFCGKDSIHYYPWSLVGWKRVKKKSSLFSLKWARFQTLWHWWLQWYWQAVMQFLRGKLKWIAILEKQWL